jgi:phospholipase B1
MILKLNLLLTLFSIKGSSWSIGGDGTLEDTFTLPNILKKFNKNLTGFSTGENVLKIPNKNSRFNVAVSGSIAFSLMDQAKELIERLKSSTDVDYLKDWKLITMFIGGNDLSDFCLNTRDKHVPSAYINYIRDALDLMQQEIPRALVSLVSVLNIGDLRDMNVGLACSELHKYECSCAAYPTSEEQIIELKTYFQNYTMYTQQLIESGRYDVSDNFTVVLQPFFKNYIAPRLADNSVDLTWFAPDCFHFSQKSHGF